MHQTEAAAAVDQLAVRPVDRPPRLEQVDDGKSTGSAHHTQLLWSQWIASPMSRRG
jgi:hypothetical protein